MMTKYELTETGKKFLKIMPEKYESLDDDFVDAVKKAIEKIKVR